MFIRPQRARQVSLEFYIFVNYEQIILGRHTVVEKHNDAICEDYLGVESEFWDYILLPEAIDGMIERLESTYAVRNYATFYEY